MSMRWAKAFGPFKGSDGGPTAARSTFLPGHPGFGSGFDLDRRYHQPHLAVSAGTRAPRLRGRTPPLAAPRLQPHRRGDQGRQHSVTFSWAAVPNARLPVPTASALTKLVGETEEVVRLSETVSTTEMTVPAETVAELKPGTYTISVTTAAGRLDFLYKPSPAGSAVLTVQRHQAGDSVVKLDPAKVTEGERRLWHRGMPSRELHRMPLLSTTELPRP